MPSAPKCYRITSQQAALALRALYIQATWERRWTEYDEFADTQALVNSAIYNLETPVKCNPAPQPDFPFDWWWGQDGSLNIEIEDNCMTPVTINVYEGCCGDDGLPSGNGGGGGGGGGSQIEQPIASSATKCDLATSLIPYFVDQAREFLVDVDTAVEQGTPILDAFLQSSVDLFDPTGVVANVVEEAVALLEVQLDPLINALDDSDLLLQTQVNYWGRTNTSRVTALTRADAINIGASLPVAWNLPSITQISSPRLWGEIFGRFCNLNRLNARVQIARGKADQSLCEYLAAENGEVYNPPPSQPGQPFPVPGTNFLAVEFGPLNLPDVEFVPIGYEIGSGFQVVATTLRFGAGEPVREGENESTVLEYGGNDSAFVGFPDVSETKNAEGWTALKYHDVYVSSAQADAILEAIEVNTVTTANWSVGAPIAGSIEIRHVAGSPFPPAGTSALERGYIIIAESV